MSTKNKAILVVSTIILLLSGHHLYQGISNFNREIDRLLHMTETRFDDVIRELENDVFIPYASRLKTFADSNPEIIRAFAERDRQRLLDLTLPIYTSLKEENGYFHTMPFVLPDSSMFLRMHSPDYFGDDLVHVRPIMQAAALEQKQLKGFEVGRMGGFFRTVQPLFHRNYFIGLVEFGISADLAVDVLKHRLRSPAALYYVDDLWEKATKRDDDQDHFGRYTLLSRGDPIFRKLAATLAGEQEHGRFIFDNRFYLVHSHPLLKNYLGETVGGIVVLQDVTGPHQRKKRFVTQNLFITTLLLILAFLVLYFSFGKLIGTLERYRKKQDRLLDELKGVIDIQTATEQELMKYRDQLEYLVEERTAELEKALAEVKTLSGLLPICASCKKIRDDKGFWNQVETYVQQHSEATFSHSICPECARKLYPDLKIDLKDLEPEDPSRPV